MAPLGYLVPILALGLGAPLPMLAAPDATHAAPAPLPKLTAPVATRPPSGLPQIKPVHMELKFAHPQQGEDTPFMVYFLDQKGAKVYRFECHAGGYPDESIMKFSGDFQCALFAFKNDTVSAVNLLAADSRAEQSVDWRNRGRVLARQFQGECLAYPEYSTLRHFRFRELAVTLSFTDIGWQGSTLAGFTLHLDAVHDPDAQSEMTAVPEGPTPPKSCYPGTA